MEDDSSCASHGQASGSISNGAAEEGKGSTTELVDDPELEMLLDSELDSKS